MTNSSGDKTYRKYQKYKTKYLKLKLQLQYGGAKKFLILGGPIISESSSDDHVVYSGSGKLLIKNDVDFALFDTFGNHSNADIRKDWNDDGKSEYYNTFIANSESWNSIETKYDGIIIDNGSNHWLPSLGGWYEDSKSKYVSGILDESIGKYVSKIPLSDSLYLSIFFNKCLNDNGLILININHVTRSGDNIIIRLLKLFKYLEKTGISKFLEIKGFINIRMEIFGIFGWNTCVFNSELLFGYILLPIPEYFKSILEEDLLEKEFLISSIERLEIFGRVNHLLTREFYNDFAKIKQIPNIETDAKFLQMYQESLTT